VNQLVVVGRGRMDSQAWYKAWNPGWTDWTQFGGIFTSGLGANSYLNNTSGTPIVEVVGRGQDGLTGWQKFFNGTSWGDWTSIGGGLTSSLATTFFTTDGTLKTVRFDAFARGQDNAMWHAWGQATSWTSWEWLDGQFRSGPAAVSWGPNRIDVFGPGLDGQLWHRKFDGAWHAWEALGGMITSGAAASTWGPGHIDLFARGLDNQCYHMTYIGDNNWTGWEAIGGQFISGFGATSWAVGRIDVFGIGTDNDMWHQFSDNNGWHGWEQLGGQFH
jgi:hypothetical protein